MTDLETVRPHLDRLLARFDSSFLEPDPLAAALPFAQHRHDFETAALIAALFAYGRADLIQKTGEKILGSMGNSPAQFCRDFVPSENRRWQKNFVYRFQKRADLVALVTAIGRAHSEHGGLRELFLRHDTGDAADYIPALSGFCATLRRYAKVKPSRSFNHLLSDPSKGGACKRLHLFLRWMIRRDDVDPGHWADHLSASRLLIPLDTHVTRIAQIFGLLTRQTADLKAARELTSLLRRLDHVDPIKYDFALCSFGKLGYCTKTPNRSRCDSCDMKEICGV